MSEPPLVVSQRGRHMGTAISIRRALKTSWNITAVSQYGGSEQLFLSSAESGFRFELGKKDTAGFPLRGQAMAKIHPSQYVPRRCR